MFTGIIEEVGTVVEPGERLRVACRKVGADGEPGASLAVSGVCLTVVDRAARDDGTILSFDLSPETLARTSLAALGAGDCVNLERPVTLLARLGGHLVQGHVDGVGRVADVREVSSGREVRIETSDDLGPYIAEKGSIAVDGVSLTVTEVAEGTFGVALVPFTLAATTLGTVQAGARVNIEVDVIAKYVANLMRERR
jgi:riboflavin synthase